MFLLPSHKKLLRQHAIFLDDGLPAGADGVKPNDQFELIFEHALPDFIDQQRDALGPDHRVPVMFWAHGGNVPRTSAIQEVVDRAPVWIDNGVYPIYLLWDTGPFATMVDLFWKAFTGAEETKKFDHVKAALKGEPEDGWFVDSADLLGVPIDWGQMKKAAERSNAGQDGGAFLFVESLGREKTTLEPKIELHAVGCSAGSIFHSLFLPLLLNKGYKIETLQFLAPAIRVDVFTKFITGVNDGDIGEKWMFSMDKDHEAADKLLGLYKEGSLLWFIRNVLEDPLDSDLLGIQVNFEADDDLKKTFDHLVWTPTNSGAALGMQSHAATHTAFSKDPTTLNSIAYNILGTFPQRSF